MDENDKNDKNDIMNIIENLINPWSVIIIIIWTITILVQSILTIVLLVKNPNMQDRKKLISLLFFTFILNGLVFFFGLDFFFGYNKIPQVIFISLFILIWGSILVTAVFMVKRGNNKKIQSLGISIIISYTLLFITLAMILFRERYYTNKLNGIEIYKKPNKPEELNDFDRIVYDFINYDYTKSDRGQIHEDPQTLTDIPEFNTIKLFHKIRESNEIQRLLREYFQNRKEEYARPILCLQLQILLKQINESYNFSIKGYHETQSYDDGHGARLSNIKAVISMIKYIFQQMNIPCKYNERYDNIIREITEIQNNNR